ncbi:transcriptional regulator PpsR [uncultured Jannaschia sp.]|uniref:transcriptional regulator PpsR n=1 Tax=uncultured Jannaschia sp. TaxID=293347 RepID=UPI0026381842|nr:transcriptional regulator PpsR [uncultured Jannaschia sp.]
MNTRESDFWNERSGPRIAPEYFGDIVATAADLALLISENGRVLSVTTNPLNSGIGRIDHWEGREIASFLAPDSLAKVKDQLEAVSEGRTGRPDAIEVNHADGAIWDFPVRYTFHRTGRDGRVLMLGRDMRPLAELQQRLVKAQLALERDYQTERIHETRYRVILDSVRDPLVLVDVASGRIVDLNAPAARMLGGGVPELTGSPFTQAFEGRRRGEFIDALVAADGTSLAVQMRQAGGAATLVPRLFRNAGERILLCRFETRGGDADIRSDDPRQVRLSALYHGSVEGIVLTDPSGAVADCNDAFLTLADVDSVSHVAGQQMSELLVRGTIDLNVLHDADGPRSFTTRLVTPFGSQRPVDVTATPLPDGGHAYVLRDAVARMEATESAGSGLGSIDATDQVGSVPLREIVASMTDVIEKQCIAAAVELTENNRVAAAEMLGLSRQSLYVKLRKYDLLQRDEE